MSQSTFDSTKEFLSHLLDQAGCGKLQLPDFQRGWVWDDYGIRSLLASVSQGFPIGAVMMLQSGGEVRFRPRPIEGAGNGQVQDDPERLILDGQQRLTSLYQACLLDQPVLTLNDQRRQVRRWYYIDMEAALDPTVDREDAVLSVPADRKVTRDFGREVVRDLASPEKEYKHSMFPVNRLFTSDEWEDAYQEFWGYEKEYIKFFKEFRHEVLDAFRQYQVPVISLRKETSKEAVCLVFEKVNTGGKKLDAFELLTAIYAADDFNLRDDWLGNVQTNAEGRLARLARFDVLKTLASTDFLQVIALLHTRDQRKEAEARGITNPKELPAIGCQRRAILNLPLSAYRHYADSVEKAFTLAARFLTLQKVFWSRDVPYQTQLVPLAAILAVLGDRWEQQGVRDRLARWYWCGVFGEMYGSSTETRFARDFMEVPAWIAGGAEPATITEANFAPDRLQTLRSRSSAAYKGLNALLKVKGGLDLRSGQPIEYTTFWEENVDIHHLFPKAWCRKQNIKREVYDSIVNKTPLAARTNRIISGRAPSAYLPLLEQEAGISRERMDACLASHAVDPDRMRADDFEGFMAARTEALLRLIEQAMGKPIPREQQVTEGEDPGEDIEETLESIEPEYPGEDDGDEEEWEATSPGAGGGDEDGEAAEPTDGSGWEGKGSPEMVALADRVLEIVRRIDPACELKYRKYYIGLARNGQADNYIVLRIRGGQLRLEPRLEQSDALDKELEQAGLDLMPYDRNWGRYRIRLTERDLEQRSEVIEGIIRRAREGSKGQKSGAG